MITNITLDVMNITYHGRDHDERAVPEYPGYILYLIYHRKISLCANFPGSQIALSRDCHESINNKFHDYKYLLLRYLSVLYTPTKTGECWISSSGFYLVSRNIPSWVVNLRMDLILGGFQEQVVRQLTGWIPQRW